MSAEFKLIQFYHLVITCSDHAAPRAPEIKSFSFDSSYLLFMAFKENVFIQLCLRLEVFCFMAWAEMACLIQGFFWMEI